MAQPEGATTLKALFAQSVFTVPSFQRAYAWEPDPHLNDFIQDLCNHPPDPDKPYFFGTMLLKREGRGDLLSPFAVVDGQQRLTTATVFISAALSRLQTESNYLDIVDEFSELFLKTRRRRRFRTIDEDDPFFERLILSNHMLSIETPSQGRLLAAKKYFDNFVSNESCDHLTRLLWTLADSRILVHVVESNSEATQIFELQNDRGKKLTDLEALKSYLMHSLYLHATGSTEEDLNNIQRDFAAIYRNSESIEGEYDNPDDDQLLSYHCAAFLDWRTFEDGTEQWSRPKQLVQSILRDMDKAAKVEWIKTFSAQLRETFVSATQLLKARDECHALGDLAVLGRTAIFWPLMLKCWRYQLKSPDSSERTFRAMERYAFRATIASRRANAGAPHLRRLARDFTGDFAQLEEELERMLEWYSIPELFEANLQVQDFYSRERAATYLLWQYENFLRNQPGERWPRISWRDVVRPASDAGRLAKDHIEPKDERNPVLNNLVKWKPDSEDPPRQFRDVVLNRLGNLVLDTIGAGSRRGNREFNDRIQHYLSAGFLSQSEIVNQFASRDRQDRPVWDVDAIRRRQAALVKFALEKM